MATSSVRPFPIKRDTPIENVISPFQKFVKMEASSGLVLILSLLLAMFWANYNIENYNATWNTIVTFSVGGFTLSKALLLWINDLLMAIFFLYVGLEVKREMVIGDLRNPKKAMLPISAAIGGIAIPAIIYVLMNLGNPVYLQGWAIPAATDIAFALGVLYLLGDRVPVGARMFLAMLAIIDDISAILIIAIFYSSSIQIQYLGLAFLVLLVLIGLNKLNVRSVSPYLLLGTILWYGFLKSGIHATIAGVVLALTIPATTKIDFKEFKIKSSKLINQLDTITADNVIKDEELPMYMDTVAELERLAYEVEAPLARLEHKIAPMVSFFIMPVFALANAGIIVNLDSISLMTTGMPIGIILGLVIGKPVGVMLFSLLALHLGWASLPEELTRNHLLGVGFLAGIGFTMSTFIASLAFGEPAILEIAKLAILIASIIAGITGYIILNHTAKN